MMPIFSKNASKSHVKAWGSAKKLGMGF